MLLGFCRLIYNEHIELNQVGKEVLMVSVLDKFGSKVYYYRTKKSLSQEKLAELANIHRTYIGQLERGKRNIALKNIEKIAKALGVSIKKLF